MFIQRLSTHRVIGGVTVALICAFTILIGFTISRITRAAEAEARDKARSSTIIFGERVAATIATIDSLLKVTARDLVQNPEGTSLASLVRENGFAARDLVLLTLVGPDGRVRETEQGPAEPVSLVDREHIRVHLDRLLPASSGGLFIGKPVLGRVSKKWSVQITRAVHERDGSLAGILVASLDPAYLARLWERLGLSGEDEISLTGMDGVVRMTSKNVEAVLAAGATRPALVAAASASPEGWFTGESDENGAGYFSYYLRLADHPLVVSTRISKAAALGDSTAVTGMMIMVGLLVCAAIAGTGTVLSSAVTRLARSKAEAEELAGTLEKEVRKRTAALEKANAELRTISVTDGLTGLPNRRAFDAKLKSRIAAFSRYRSPFALLLVDVDRFKSINDTDGHGTGDKVLIGIGRVLRQELRETDAAFRVGGEEFAVILSATGETDALRFAERIRSRIAARSIAGRRVSITIGVSGVRPGDDVSRIYHRADQALYAGKNDGRNRVVLAEMSGTALDGTG